MQNYSSSSSPPMNGQYGKSPLYSSRNDAVETMAYLPEGYSPVVTPRMSAVNSFELVGNGSIQDTFLNSGYSGTIPASGHSPLLSAAASNYKEYSEDALPAGYSPVPTPPLTPPHRSGNQLSPGAYGMRVVGPLNSGSASFRVSERHSGRSSPTHSPASVDENYKLPSRQANSASTESQVSPVSGIQEMAYRIIRQDHAIDGLTKSLRAKDSSIADLEESVSNLKKRIKEKDTEIVNLQNSVEMFKKDIDRMTTTHKRTVRSLEESLKESDSKLFQYREECERVVRETSSRSVIDRSTYENLLSEMQYASTHTFGSVVDMEKALEELSSKVELLQSRRGKIVFDIQRVSVSMEGMSTSMKTLSNQLTSITSKCVDLNNIVTDESSKAHTMYSRVSELEDKSSRDHSWYSEQMSKLQASLNLARTTLERKEKRHLEEILRTRDEALALSNTDSLERVFVRDMEYRLSELHTVIDQKQIEVETLQSLLWKEREDSGSVMAEIVSIRNEMNIERSYLKKIQEDSARLLKAAESRYAESEKAASEQLRQSLNALSVAQKTVKK